jgi:hypothetical protein
MVVKGTVLRRIFLALGFGLSALAPPLAVAEEEASAFEVIDPDGIYLGAGSHPKTPGVMRADEVWKEIPEYKQIIADELTEDDPQYHLLMLKATERFNQALRNLAKRDSHDMLGETGSIVAKGEAKIPVVTAEMIKLVTRG